MWTGFPSRLWVTLMAAPVSLPAQGRGKNTQVRDRRGWRWGRGDRRFGGHVKLTDGNIVDSHQDAHVHTRIPYTHLQRHTQTHYFTLYILQDTCSTTTAKVTQTKVERVLVSWKRLCFPASVRICICSVFSSLCFWTALINYTFVRLIN